MLAKMHFEPGQTAKNLWFRMCATIISLLKMSALMLFCSFKTFQFFWGLFFTFSVKPIKNSHVQVLIHNLLATHPCLDEAFGLTLDSRENVWLILSFGVYGLIWGHFWNFWLSLSQENWGQRRPWGKKVGIWENENFS